MDQIQSNVLWDGVDMDVDVQLTNLRQTVSRYHVSMD